VVLRRGERQRRLAVDQSEEARLLAAQELLDHELGAGIPEGATEAGVDRGLGLLLGRGDGDALACGKPVGLDHDWQLLRRHVSLRRRRIGEAGVSSSGDARACAEILGKAL
jgi:hypothetical protein